MQTSSGRSQNDRRHAGAGVEDGIGHGAFASQNGFDAQGLMRAANSIDQRMIRRRGKRREIDIRQMPLDVRRMVAQPGIGQGECVPGTSSPNCKVARVAGSYRSPFSRNCWR